MCSGGEVENPRRGLTPICKIVWFNLAYNNSTINKIIMGVEMKVIDCFMFFNELKMLDLRLNILNDYVDSFVLVESKEGHTNKPKPLYFEENKHLFEKFLPKIKHHVIETLPHDSSWSNEAYQRDAICVALQNEPDDAIIFVSDLDEIWNPEKIMPILPTIDDTKIYRYGSKICYFYFNLVADMNEWVQPLFMKHSLLKKYTNRGMFLAKFMKHSLLKKYISPGLSLTNDIMRNKRNKISKKNNIILSNTGWHFSYTENPILKLDNFIHSEYNKPPYNTKNYLAECIRNRVNPFHKTPMYVIPQSQLKDYLPKYVLDHIDDYKHLILIE